MWAGHSKSVRALCQSKVVWAWAQTAQLCNEGRTAGSGSRKRTVCLETVPEEALQDTEPNQKLKWKLSKEDESQQRPERPLQLNIWACSLLLKSAVKGNDAVIIACCSPRWKGHSTQDWEGIQSSRFGAWCRGNKAREAAQPFPTPHHHHPGRPGSHSQASFCSKKATHICKWRLFFFFLLCL